jgi:hypothetical protein
LIDSFCRPSRHGGSYADMGLIYISVVCRSASESFSVCKNAANRFSVCKNTAKMPPFLALLFRAFAAFLHSLATAMVSKTLPQKHKLYNTSPPNPKIAQVAIYIKAKTYLAVVKRLFEYLR